MAQRALEEGAAEQAEDHNDEGKEDEHVAHLRHGLQDALHEHAHAADALQRARSGRKVLIRRSVETPGSPLLNISTKPMITTRKSSQFHPWRRYELGCSMRPCAIILITISIKKMIRKIRSTQSAIEQGPRPPSSQFPIGLKASSCHIFLADDPTR